MVWRLSGSGLEAVVSGLEAICSGLEIILVVGRLTVGQQVVSEPYKHRSQTNHWR